MCVFVYLCCHVPEKKNRKGRGNRKRARFFSFFLRETSERAQKEGEAREDERDAALLVATRCFSNCAFQKTKIYPKTVGGSPTVFEKGRDRVR